MKNMEEGTSGITRRSFLTGASAGAMAIAAGSLVGNVENVFAETSDKTAETASDQVYGKPIVHMENVNPIKPVSEPNRYDYETDILIIGYGVGGTSAGLTALNGGAKVIAIETSSENTWYEHAGVHNLVVMGEPSWLQREGIPAWNEQIIESMLDGDQHAYPHFSNADREAVKAMYLNELPAFQQITALGDGCKFEFVEIFPKWKHMPVMVPLNDNLEGGSLYYPWSNKYHAVEHRIRAYSESKGLQILWGTPATNLIVDSSGRVVGAKGLKKADHSDVYIKAKCTIISTGGHGANYDMVQYYGVIDDMAGCHVGPITNVGDGQRMAQGVGCDVRGIPRWAATASESGLDSKKLGLPWTFVHENSATEKCGLTVGRQISAYTYAPINIARQSCLKVNKYGKRFMNEADDWFPRVWNEYEQPDHCFYAIYDGDIEATIAKTNERYGMCEYLITPDRYVYFSDDDIRQMYKWQDEFQDGIDKGYIVKADTLEELAEKLEINAENFVASVARYNELVDAGNDTDYGVSAAEMFAVKTAPFYGMRRKPCFIWQCEGGIATDGMTGRVIDKKGSFIPGLYCGSNDAATTNFDAYNNQISQTAGAATFALTQGYIAAKNALKELA